MVDLGVWTSGLNGVTDCAIPTAGVAAGMADEGAVLIMTGGTTVSPVQTVDQIGVGVTHCAGGGGPHLCGMRGGGGMDIEVSVAVHTITWAFREGETLQQSGGGGMAISAIPTVDVINRIATVTDGALRGGIYLAAMV